MFEEKISVLIVNSNREMREYLCEQLPTSGFIPVCSDSIHCALKKLEQTDVEAIVCDETLKDGTAIELIERLRRCGIRTPFGILMSEQPKMSEIQILARGADLVFEKPFGLGDFVDGLRTLTGLTPSPGLTINGQNAWSSTDSTRNSPHRA